MSIEARCRCGHRETLSEAFRGQTVRCAACGAPVTAAESKDAPRRGTSPLLIAVILLVAISGLLGFILRNLPRRSGPPAKAETAEEKYRSASETFANRPPEAIDPKSDEAAVRAALVALGQDAGAGNAKAFAGRFHARRLLAEIENSGAKLPLKSRSEADAFARGIVEGMSKSPSASAGNTLQWKSIQPVRVILQPERGEAEAFAFVRFGSWKGKFRFWLIKDQGAWKVFDYDSLEDGLRFSVTAGLLSAGAIRSVATSQAYQAWSLDFKAYTEAVVTGKTKQFPKDPEAIERAAPVPVLRGQVAVLRGSALANEGRFEESLQAADRALKMHPDLPSAVILRARALHGLKRFEDSLAASREYLRRLGDDPDGWAWVALALEGLGKTAEALDAYRRGAAADSEESDCRIGLGRLLAGAGKSAEALDPLLEACRNKPSDPETFDSASGLLADHPEELAALCTDRAAALPDHGPLHYAHGTALARLKKLAEAEKAFRAGLSREGAGRKNDYAVQLVPVLARLGKDKEASELLGSLEKADPDDLAVDPAFLRVLVDAAAKRDEAAAKGLAALLKESPWHHEEAGKEELFDRLRGRTEVRAALSAAKAKCEFDAKLSELEAAKKHEEARALCEERTKAAPDDAGAWGSLGQALLGLGKPAEAAVPLRKAAELDPACIPFRTDLGMALARSGKADEARAIAEALEKEGADERAYPRSAGRLLRARIEAMAGRPAEALAAVGKLLDQAPYWVERLGRVEELADVLRRPEAGPILDKARKALERREE